MRRAIASRRSPSRARWCWGWRAARSSGSASDPAPSGSSRCGLARSLQASDIVSRELFPSERERLCCGAEVSVGDDRLAGGESHRLRTILSSLGCCGITPIGPRCAAAQLAPSGRVAAPRLPRLPRLFDTCRRARAGSGRGLFLVLLRLPHHRLVEQRRLRRCGCRCCCCCRAGLC